MGLAGKIARGVTRLFLGGAMGASTPWTSSKTTKESAIALARMNPDQRRDLLRMAAINKEHV
jgi:hypothetical protein